MTKAIIRFGYDSYVMDAEDALAIHEILARAENYKSKYQRAEEGGTLHYIWDQDGSNETKTIEIMSDSLYRMAKLAGKPEDK